MMMLLLGVLLLLTAFTSGYPPSMSIQGEQQVLKDQHDRTLGHNQPFVPTPKSPMPEKAPLNIDEDVHWHEQHFNGSGNGIYRRSSCPAVNTLANRGYINRTGRNVSYEEIAQAFRDVFNFGDDNIILVLAPLFAVNGWPNTIDLDYFNNDKAQYLVNCPAAPARQDRELGDNITLNMTMFENMLSFSKDDLTLSLEDMAEYHHLRHNQSRESNPNFRYSNRIALCALAQYTSMVGMLGRMGKHGQHTLYIEDVREFYLKEDLPTKYMRREAPYYSTEAQALVDRMTNHIGYFVERPLPPFENEPHDIEPAVAKYESK